MTAHLADRVDVWDADAHIVEPPDLWTSRVPERFGALVPHVAWSDERGELAWVVGDRELYGIGTFAMAGWHEYLPGHPPTLEDADPAAWQPADRLARMDEYGVHTQVLYPNIIGFFMGAFLRLGQPELLLACVRAYNDYVAEFAAHDPARLVPVMMLPYWDLDESLREIDRAMALGHRGIVSAGRLDGAGQPPLRNRHWDPLWAAAQERGLPVNFHIGFNADPDPTDRSDGEFTRAGFAESSAQSFMANMRTIAEVICSGIPHRFPELKIVSVESGAGWLPYFLESLDWQWLNTGVHTDRPDWDLPSDYFRRQIHATYWFERDTLAPAAAGLTENLMYSTDFPHPTSQSPGPASSAVNPRQYIDETLAGQPEHVARRLLHDNAARVYTLR